MERGTQVVGRRARALLALAWLALTVLVLRTTLWAGDAPDPVAVRSGAVFDPERVAADSSYRTGLWVAAVALTLLGPVVPILAVATRVRWSERLATGVRGRIWLGGGMLGAAVALGSALLAAPVRLWRHDWVRDSGVGRQPRGEFIVDLLQSALVQAAILAAVGAAAAVAIARLSRAWWAVLGATVAVVGAALTLLGPAVIGPLFERTTPLRDPAIVADVRALARTAGVEVGEVAVSDAARRSRIVNARVEGLFGTQRVVLDDTLTNDVARSQVRWVVAHELVHVARRHVLKGVVWFVALTMPLAFFVSAFVGAGAAASAGEALRRTAAALAAVSVILTLATPLGNWVSRAYEVEADWDALALTKDPDAAIAHRVLARDLARSEPDPPRLLHLWFGTHPTPLERVGLAERYRR